MNFALHPDAVREHEEQVAYYEARASGLGVRYHAEFLATMHRICAAPYRFRIMRSPGIRRAFLCGFPFCVIFREAGGLVQVLAIAPHPKRPGYWTGRDPR